MTIDEALTITTARDVDLWCVVKKEQGETPDYLRGVAGCVLADEVERLREESSELENTRKWARKAVVLQEQQAAEIEQINKLWECEHATVVRLVAERDAARAEVEAAFRAGYRRSDTTIETDTAWAQYQHEKARA